MIGRTSTAAVAALLAVGAAAALLAWGAAASAAPPPRPSAVPPARPSAAAPPRLAGACVAIESLRTGRFLAAGSDEYTATARTRADATRFFLKPSGLGTYLPYDRGGGLLSARGRAREAGPRTEWRVARDGGRLVLAGRRVGGRRGEFALVPARGCRPFPEARVGATGRPFAGTRRDGTVLGFADAHVHITGDMRAGGRVVYGEAFDRFGIQRALGNDARDHGADGSLDVTGNLLRTGLPFGTHDIHGWPTFAGWPVHDTVTHQQTYYVWLERAWMAGLRLVVAQTVEDRTFCRIEPRRRFPCSEPAAIKGQIRRLRALQDYVDAQSGGRGRGWFRLVYTPRQARRAIERGKLAVVIGIESSNLFGCGRRGGRLGCTARQVDRRLDEFHRLGVRGVFVAHWTDNAFAGPALEGGARGIFINIFNRLETGAWFRTSRCPAAGQGEEVGTLGQVELGVLADLFPGTREVAEEGMPAYPPGRQCNVNGLTPLGRHLVAKLMDGGMLIEADHLSERARDQVLGMAARRGYPLVSSHNGTGGSWTPRELRRLYALGGFAAATPDIAPRLASKVLRLRRFRGRERHFGVGLGTDTGGFAELPGPRPDAARHPLRYPFRSFDGRVRFARQRTGSRVFDLNRDGVAHYGLFADLLADMQRTRRGRRALDLLFGSAEAYLRTWERASRAAGPHAAN